MNTYKMKSRMDMAARMPSGNLICFLFTCTLCPLVITVTFMYFYWMLFLDATKVNDANYP